MPEQPDFHELYKQRIAHTGASRGSIGPGDGVTDGEKAFMYVMAFVGFLFVLWMKREAVSDTRKRVTKHLREIDQPLDQDNFHRFAAGSSSLY